MPLRGLRVDWGTERQRGTVYCVLSCAPDYYSHHHDVNYALLHDLCLRQCSNILLLGWIG